MKRRDFLQQLALATGAMMVPMPLIGGQEDKYGTLLPLRPLGKTGEMVTMLGVGGWHIAATSEKDTQEVIETALAQGVRFFDTAHNYSKGESEIRYGKWLNPKYRDDIYLMTKSAAKDYDSARKELELSLQRMKTDRVDLWQLHSLVSPEDADHRLNNGVLQLAQDAIKEGKVRHIGITGHADPQALIHLMKNKDAQDLISTVQCPVNPVDAQSHASFIEQVLPLAVEQNIGILAMKTLAFGRLLGKQINRGKIRWEGTDPLIPNYMDLEEVFQFVWSLPISTLITGAETAALLEEKIAFAKKAITLQAEQRQALVDKIGQHPQLKEIEYYKKV